jgi:hypothetical protein
MSPDHLIGVLRTHVAVVRVRYGSFIDRLIE